jgi:hypothetical protein
MKPNSPKRRGRPPKFGRPGQVVAVTLPDDVVSGLREIHSDLGWAIVTMFEKASKRVAGRTGPQPVVQLVTVAHRRSLIVVNQAVFRTLPGVNIIPLNDNWAFLALDSNRGLTDLELTVIDRLEDPSAERRERKALSGLRSQLRAWRLDPALRFHTRSIIVVERMIARHRAQASVA